MPALGSVRTTFPIPVLALVVILPLFLFLQGPGAGTLRAVDFVALYASGVALGVLLTFIGGAVRRSRVAPAHGNGSHGAPDLPPSS